MTLDELRALPTQKLLDLYIDAPLPELGRVTRVLREDRGIDVSRFAQRLHSRMDGTQQVKANHRVRQDWD